MNKEALGRRINITRKELGLTSEKLSELCNINATYLRQIESGRKIPSLPVFLTICENLKVSPSYLLLDTLSGNESGNTDSLMALVSTATPNQLKLITAMIESALNTIQGE